MPPIYSFDANGNLLSSDTLTNTWDAANRLVETERAGNTLQPVYNGLGNRVGQTIGVSTTNYALDVAGGLPEVIYTSQSEVYLHLPGVIVAQNDTTTRYLLADGLGSIRQATDEAGTVVAYHEFDLYGNPVDTGGDPYGYTGEWWEEDLGLLHLRARWYAPEMGIFLSRDAIESEPPYQYVRGNPVNLTDPSGLYTNYTSGQVNAIQQILFPWLADSARRHNMSNTNLGNGAFAALIVTIMYGERKLIDLRTSDEFGFEQGVISGLEQLGDIGGSYFGDKSLGPGNTKESTTWDIVHGRVRKTNGWEEAEGPREYFNECFDYNLKPARVYIYPDPRFGLGSPYASTIERLISQDYEYAIDLVGAHIQQGAVYALRKETNETLGVFNFIAWYNGGVILDEELNRKDPLLGTDKGHQSRGHAAKMIDTDVFSEALEILRETSGTGPDYIDSLFNYKLGDAYYNYKAIKK